MIGKVKSVTRFPKYVLSNCPDVTAARRKTYEEAYFIFYNQDNKIIGAAAINYNTYSISKLGLPEWEIFIESFEVYRKYRGQGYGGEMLRWIEENLPIRKIELCHRLEEDDNSASRIFWEKHGFTKPRLDCQDMEKYETKEDRA